MPPSISTRATSPAGTDYLWVEPVREDLHRRALDAHLRLAELEGTDDRYEAALEVLEHAVHLDPVAEEAYRRLMTLEGRIGRFDSIAATWRQLQRNLADLDADPAPATSRLYQELMRAHQRADSVVHNGR